MCEKRIVLLEEKVVGLRIQILKVMNDIEKIQKEIRQNAR